MDTAHLSCLLFASLTTDNLPPLFDKTNIGVCFHCLTEVVLNITTKCLAEMYTQATLNGCQYCLCDGVAPSGDQVWNN